MSKTPGAPPKDEESNRLGRRVRRYAQVGAGVGGLAAKVAGQRFFGLAPDNDKTARELKVALGGLKGPIMKVAQMLATIPDVVPAEFAAELSELQSAAPAMGWPFVKRRMRAELGAGWETRFKSFEHEAAAAASLGQVHRATGLDERSLAAKLQYPDMQSAVDADLNQLGIIFSIHRRLDQAIDTREIYAEIRARLVEELDYAREAAHMRLYADIFAGEERISVPEAVEELSTRRLLTMTWLEGKPLLSFRDRKLKERNAIAEAMFMAWWYPFSHYGVIHGDPHLGNYTVRGDLGINLLDYGCIRIFPAAFVEGVVELYRALETDDRDRAAAAYARWGFSNLSNELIDVLNVWARFIYAPMLDDRVRSIADGISAAEYGRKEAFQVHQALRKLGPVTPPREFVFMDRAAIGLGGVFLHLGAELNFHKLFNETIEGFEAGKLDKRQAGALKKAGVPKPE
jgi:predicted unusual protein kinase regulating ubiquinone biosynthesis (AarF/ABC1/UbiB family)